MGVTAGPAESNGKLLLGIWRNSLHVTCGLTACTPGSAPGPTLGNEYGKTLPFLPFTSQVGYVIRKTVQNLNPPNSHQCCYAQKRQQILLASAVTAQYL